MITVVQAVKRMRGPSRAVHAVADNGWHYVVKPPSIGHRAMINEWLGAKLLQMVGVMTADVRPVIIPGEIAKEQWPEFSGISVVGTASAFPVDPTQHAIYDFVPRMMAEKIANLDHAVGALAVDFWVGMTERRHFVYFRQGPWWACCVDNKGMFGGRQWNCLGGGLPTNPAARWTYESVLSEKQIDLWSAQILAIKPGALYRLLDEVPECWAATLSASDLYQLADLLLSRRARVPAMLRGVAGTSSSRIGLTCDTMSLNASCLSS